MKNIIHKLGENNRKLISNFFSLSLLQGFNLVLPFIILPHILKIYGLETFGVIMLAQTIMTYLKGITDYGFSLTAVKELSIERDNNISVNRIFNNVVFCKLFLIIICYPILFIFIFIQPKFDHYALLVFMSSTVLIGQSFLPSWFFQGIEKMHILTILNFFSKLISVVVILLFINHYTNPIWVNFIIGLSDIVAGLIGFYIIIKNYNIKIKIISYQAFLNQLRYGWDIFISNFAVTIYVNSSSFILGFFANSVTLGLFTLAEKIYMMLRTVLVVFFQVTYPHVCILVNKSHIAVIEFYKRQYRLFLIGIAILCSLLFASSNLIALHLLDTNMDVHSLCNLIKIFAIVPLIIALNIPYYQMLVVYNYSKEYKKIYIVGMFFAIIVNIVLSMISPSLGPVIAILVTELFIAFSFCWKVEFDNKEIAIFNFKPQV